MFDVTVVVGTFGDKDKWGRLAARAIRSVHAFAPNVPVIHSHDATLHDARNKGIESASTEWVVVLDADDELEASYFDAMDAGDTDLRAPLVRFVTGSRANGPAKIPAGTSDLTMGNNLVIGTAVRRQMVLDVGGFEDWPIFEDWALWLRCHLAGATVGFTEAVYRAHVRPGSRNRAPSQRMRAEVHDAIRRAVMPWLFEEDRTA